MKHHHPGRRPRTFIPAAETGPRNTVQRSTARRSQAAVISLRRDMPSPVKTDLPIQRVVTQILPSRDEPIGQLLIVGRPERLFTNSMGDHTTAFATHVEAIKLKMEHRSPAEALEGLKRLASEATNLPGFSLKDQLPTGHDRLQGNRLDTAQVTLLDRFEEAESLVGVEDTTPLLLKLQECVNAYLEFRELIPLSAVNVLAVAPAKAGKGKGESKHAGILARHERSHDVSQEQLQAAILGSFDIKAAAMVVATTSEDELAKLAPGLSPKTPLEKRAALLAEQHLLAIQSGFPQSAADSGIEVEILAKIILEKATKKLLKDKIFYARKAEKAQEDLQALGRGIDSGVTNTSKDLNRLGPLFDAFEFFNNRLQLISNAIPEGAEAAQNKRKREDEKEKGKGKKKEKGPEKKKRKVGGKSDDKEKEKEKDSPEVVEEAPEALEEAQEEAQEEAKEREEEEVREEERKSPVATQIVLINAGQIKEVQIAGRPFSPISGTMGAHTSAWVLHTERVKKALFGKSIEEAWKTVKEELVPEAEKLFDILQEANPPTAPGQEALAEEARERLKTRGKITLGEDATAARLAFTLQLYINELLTFINYIPGVTREAANVDGRAEAKHRAVLEDMEKSLVRQRRRLSRTDFEAVDEAIDGLLDTKKLDNKEVYKKAHYELVRKVYPKTFEAFWRRREQGI